YVSNVSIPGKGVHNVVYVTTQNASVYAFDADGNSDSSPLWYVSFINPAAGIVPADPGTLSSPSLGIVSTPVIDGETGTLYVIVKTKETSGGVTNYVHRLHALSIATGSERPNSPVVIQASLPGTGDGS